MTTDLSNRVTIITGATGGLGSAIATEFYKLGASLVITARDPEKLNTLRDKIVASSEQKTKTPAPLCVPLDLTSIDADETLIQKTIQEFGKLDILINNAGITDSCLLLKTTPAFLDKMMQVNFTTPYHLCRKAIPYMTKNKFGRIINITSIAGQMGEAGMSAYTASKGAMAAATKSIAAEYGKRGITANCIAPGVINTESAKAIPAERAKELKSQIPMKRYGRPEEIAYLAAFLASEYAAYINGQEMRANGGLSR